jgi:hypothetical protein
MKQTIKRLAQADLQILQDYVIYVETKIDLKELPLDFEQWQELENSTD